VAAAVGGVGAAEPAPTGTVVAIALSPAGSEVGVVEVAASSLRPHPATRAPQAMSSSDIRPGMAAALIRPG
jgi:hypothetical protein